MTATAGTRSPAPAEASTPPGRPRRRVVLWSSLAVAVVVAALAAVFAAVGPSTNAVASSPLLGKPAPPVSGPALGGGSPVTLASLRGRWVLVNFSASWCVPCRQELPFLRRLAAWGASPNVPSPATVLTVAYDPHDLSGLRSLLASQGDTWPAVDDPAASVAYGLRGIPESYLVDPEGTVVEKVVGGVDTRQVTQIERFIGQFPSAPAGGSSG